MIDMRIPRTLVQEAKKHCISQKKKEKTISDIVQGIMCLRGRKVWRADGGCCLRPRKVKALELRLKEHKTATAPRDVSEGWDTGDGNC